MANTFLGKDGLSHLITKLKTYIATQISAHTSNKNNPHGVTKAQVGLGSVANLDQSKAIKSISRSGTTFTATALDGTTTTFTQQDNNTTYGSMSGASASAAGTSGLVPAPSAGAANRYLRSDGTWAVPPDTDTKYSAATSSAAGLMSSSDKAKLDGIASGANKYTHPGYTAHSSGLYKVTVDSTGHVSSVASVAKSDITALGIPGQDTNTTYSDATTSSHGLMSAADKAALDGLKNGSTALKNIGRPTTANTNYHDSKVRFMFASSSMTEGKPYDYGFILHFSWDSGNWEAQLFIPNNSNHNEPMQFRYMDGSNWTPWFDIYSKNYPQTSTTKSFTLSASSWSSGSYKISDSLITASSNQEVLPAVGITSAQYNALSKAQIVDGGQAAGSMTLKALGTVPTIDIPIRIVFRGTI